MNKPSFFCIFLFYKLSTVIINFRLLLIYSAESCHTCHITSYIHLKILASFLSQVMSSTKTGELSVPYSATHVEFDQLFAPKSKPLMVNNGTNSSNVLYPLLILVVIQPTPPSFGSTVSPSLPVTTTTRTVINKKWSKSI